MITGWNIYLDGKFVYSAGAVNTIHANVTASVGSHAVVVRAWDSSGAYGDQSVTVEVHPVAVNIHTPMNATAASSPVNIQATALSGHTITGWHVYLDSIDSFAQNDGNSIDMNLALCTGVHRVLVRAWDSTGAFGDQTISVIVP